MVEVDGERVLTASCVRKPSKGMVVTTQNEWGTTNSKLVFELLASDMPARENSPDPVASFWQNAESAGLDGVRFAGDRPGAQSTIPAESIFHDASHPSNAVNLDVCISCNLCERACRDV
ncbi:MAG: formate dehydrogenase major subunit [Alteromonas macleodii]|jgi:formate dehydrogenase major subunit